MTRSFKSSVRPLFLGIEGGGTHTVAILADAQKHFLQRFEAGPANLKLLGDAQLNSLLKSIAAAFPQPDAIAIGLAGARTESDCERIRKTAAKVWPSIPCHATNDLETALATVDDERETQARVLILSGTGSCCFGRNASGKTAKMGGWGHILGDKGSGYEIGLRALKAVVFYLDRDGEWSKLGQRILNRLQLNEPNELIAWVQTADKAQIASIAVETFAAWKNGDKIAADILKGAQATLAKDGLSCAHKIARAGEPVHFILAGGILTKQPQFSRALGMSLRKSWPGAMVSTLERESVWGAVNLAEKNWRNRAIVKNATKSNSRAAELPKILSSETTFSKFVKTSPTEQRNPRSLKLDKLPIADAVKLMLSEDAKIPAAILVEKKKIAQAVSFIANAFKHGGRLFYIGAGTSGRLGVLDASECPPTFGTAPELVQGIIAGGQGALWRSVEGAEDDRTAGARAIEFRGVKRGDVVVGIAASGRTPYVWGAMAEARKHGAKTILLSFNPSLKIAHADRPTLVIAPNVGPEILTGSTRLKAGTATKLVLNIFTTLAMVRTGKVVSNLMVDLNPSNLKLRDRAVRIVQELGKVDYDAAQSALENSGWVIKPALKKLSVRKRRT